MFHVYSSRFAGLFPSGSPVLKPPSRNYDVDRQHGLVAEEVPASAHSVNSATLQLSASTSVAGHECLVASNPSQAGHSYDTPVTNALRALYQNRSPSLTFKSSPIFLLSLSKQYYEECRTVHQSPQPEHSNLAHPQATLPHIKVPNIDEYTQCHVAPPVNPRYSVDPQYYEPYVGHSALQHCQIKEVLPVGDIIEQQRLTCQPPVHASCQCFRCLRNRSIGLFNNAHDFIINDSVFVNNDSDNFMASLLQATIPGAEFDSSDRNMPLRCHPGTRIKIIKHCQDFILDRGCRPKLRWVVGAAGVGKSAIMQPVAHEDFDVLSGIIVGATIFFSINGRQDGTKALITIAYQLAVKLNPYRLYIQREVTRDPSLLRKSLPTQFKKFIVEPFIHQRILEHSSWLLIMIDGLDECACISVQKELLSLISDFCLTCPTSPFLWIIASRPEPHITSFFSQPNITLFYEKEEILVDLDDAHEDVKRYLHDKFREIQMESITLQNLAQWPSRGDFLKIANASGGLFAYASMVVRYISDPDYGDPVALLDDVLEIIAKGTKENIWGRNHPMAQLDALYSHIMSKIPTNVMVNTRKLLLLDFQADYSPLDFHLSCNLLGLTRNAAYGAIHHIRSIAIVPGPTEAARSPLQFFHQSFHDYLRDFERSGFSRDTWSECDQLFWQCALRILEEAPNGVYINDTTQFCSSLEGAVLKSGLGIGEAITVSWPVVGEGENHRLRLAMYDVAIGQVMEGFKRGDKAFQSVLCLRALTTCFAKLPQDFPFDVVREFTFNESRRLELLEHGIIREVLLETFDWDEITIGRPVQLRFCGPTVESSNLWNMFCRHQRKGSWEGPCQDWSTHFRHEERYNTNYKCSHCFEQFRHHFETRHPDQLVTVLDLTPTSQLVELRFVDPGDGMSDWIYHFFTGEDDEYYYYEEKSEEE